MIPWDVVQWATARGDMIPEALNAVTKPTYELKSAVATPAEKPLTTNERNTLLTIIAALCDYSDIDWTVRGVAGQIAKLTDEIGAPVTDDTVRKWLELIPGALERRKK